MSVESICNDGLLSIGQETITDLDDTSDPVAVKLKSIWTQRLKFLLSWDWVFNRKREQLTRVYKLTIDTAPAPSAFAVGATLTGTNSGTTCTVKRVESTTVYWVTEPDGDFTDGEIIGDGTNTATTTTGYPAIDTTPPAFGTWQYAFAIPDDYLCNLKLVDLYSDKVQYPFHREGYLFFADIPTGYAKYNANLTDVTVMPDWFTNLLSMDLAQKLVAKFISVNDSYAAVRAEKRLADAWMDAHSGNGRDSFAQSAGGETDGNTDSYEGYRNSSY